MTDRAPDDIVRLARERAEARQRRDYGAADELRSTIERAGWKVVDSGGDFRLEPTHPPDVERDGIRYHGASATVPSRLDEEPSFDASVVLPVLAGARVPDISSLPPGVQRIVVLDDALESDGGAPAGQVEVVRMATPVGLGGCWNVGIRRALGRVVVLIGRDGPLGDALATAVQTLGDEAIAVAGRPGLISPDLRHWGRSDGPVCDAVGPDLVAFRRSDAAVRGPLDERFSDAQLLAVWWSLVLRDEGAELPPRQALAVGGGAGSGDAPAEAERSRPARRDFYRVIDRFGHRYDLLRDPVRRNAEGQPVRRR